MTALIEVQDLHYALPTSKHAPPTANPQQEGHLPFLLQQITFSIQEGEYVAIIGANGSGKTTLARHLNGLLLPTRGWVKIAGMDTRHRPNLPAIRSLVGMVFQFPEDQLVAGTVEEDIAFGLENQGLPAAEIRQRVEEALAEMGLCEERKRPPHLLSAGQIQRLALAGILAVRPRCIIFDESSSMLDPHGRRGLQTRLEQLNQAGITIIFITHNMDEAARAKRVMLLHQGRLILDGTPDEVFQPSRHLETYGVDLPPAASLAHLLQPYLARFKNPVLTESDLLTNLPPYFGPVRRFPLPRQTTPPISMPMVEVNSVVYTYLSQTPFARQALRGVSATVERATCCGLAGGTGSGKTTLLQMLNGLNRPQEGRVRVGPYHLDDHSIAIRSVAQMVGIAFQIPDYQLFAQYVGDEIAYGPRQVGKLDNLAERVKQAMQRSGLDFNRYKDRLTFSLSGGEKRRVALAAALAMEPALLLLDEPLSGLDPAARAEMIQRFQSWVAEGMTLVFSSHNMDDHAALANHMVVLKNGYDFLSGKPQEVFERTDLLEATMLEPPLAARVATRLRRLGWNIPPGVITPFALRDCLAKIKENTG